jgi:hypothetical protein
VTTHYVYFITEVTGKNLCVKIGVTHDLATRLSDLQTGNSQLLKVAAKIGPVTEMQAYEIERGIHYRFRKSCVRGEWFQQWVLTQLVLQGLPPVERSESHHRRKRAQALDSEPVAA